MKGINFIRTIYYIPSLIGGSIGIAILWKLMFQEEGIINSLLKAIHLPTLHWLGDPKTALPTIILLQLWTFGSSFVMFLAALKMYRRICMKQRISMEPAAGRNSLRLHCHRFPLLYFQYYHADDHSITKLYQLTGHYQRRPVKIYLRVGNEVVHGGILFL